MSRAFIAGRRLGVAVLCILACSTAVSQAQNKPEPASKPARIPTTEVDFYRESIPYFRKLLAELYVKAGSTDPALDVQAKRFLDDMAEYLARLPLRAFYHPTDKPTAAELLHAGLALQSKGSKSPIIHYCLAELLEKNGRPAEAVEMYGLADKNHQITKLSAVLGLRIATRSALLRPSVDNSSGKLYAGIAAGPLDNAARQQGWRMVSQAKKPLAWRGQLVNGIDALPNPDPWLRDMIAGRLHIDLAWQARGSGLADTVTEEGWKGFYSNLQLARDCFLRAIALAPDLPQPADQMITVAKGLPDSFKEDPTKWFKSAIAVQADWSSAYANILTALMPRWGGSHEQMLEIGLDCLKQDRYDTLIPWQFVVTVDAISNDLGQPWVLLETPKVYELTAGVLESYAKQCGPGRGNYFQGGRVAIAIRTGKLDEARRLQEEWKAAGGQLDYEAFTYFGVTGGAVDASRVYAFTGPAKAEMAQMDQHLQARREPEALAIAKAAKAKTPAGDSGHLFLDHTIGRLTRAAEYRTGQWVSLPADLSEWRMHEGQWHLNDAGGFVSVNSDATKARTLLYRGPLPLDPVAGFEISVVMQSSANPPVPGAPGGIAFFMPGRTTYRGWVHLGIGKTAGQFTFGQDRVRFDIPAANEMELTVRCRNYVLTAYQNGKQLGEPFELPERYRGPELQAGIGGSTGNEVTFSNIRVRDLSKVND